MPNSSLRWTRVVSLLALLTGCQGVQPSTGVDQVESRQLLSKWLGHLDDRELEVATLLFVDGLTQQEVADMLGLSRKTIVREGEELRQKLQALGALPGGAAA